MVRADRRQRGPVGNAHEQACRPGSGDDGIDPGDGAVPVGAARGARHLRLPIEAERSEQTSQHVPRGRSNRDIAVIDPDLHLVTDGSARGRDHAPSNRQLCTARLDDAHMHQDGHHCDRAVTTPAQLALSGEEPHPDELGVSWYWRTQEGCVRSWHISGHCGAGGVAEWAVFDDDRRRAAPVAAASTRPDHHDIGHAMSRSPWPASHSASASLFISSPARVLVSLIVSSSPTAHSHRLKGRDLGEVVRTALVEGFVGRPDHVGAHGGSRSWRPVSPRGPGRLPGRSSSPAHVLVRSAGSSLLVSRSNGTQDRPVLPVHDRRSPAYEQRLPRRHEDPVPQSVDRGCADRAVREIVDGLVEVPVELHGAIEVAGSRGLLGGVGEGQQCPQLRGRDLARRDARRSEGCVEPLKARPHEQGAPELPGLEARNAQRPTVRGGEPAGLQPPEGFADGRSRHPQLSGERYLG